MAVSNCDVLFSIGTRFNDRITGKIEEFAPHAKVIHIDIDAKTISRNIEADVPIVADAGEAIAVLLEKAVPLCVFEWVEQVRQWKKEYPLTETAFERELCISYSQNVSYPTLCCELAESRS